MGLKPIPLLNLDAGIPCCSIPRSSAAPELQSRIFQESCTTFCSKLPLLDALVAPDLCHAQDHP